jgi:capsular exopolysaccharide synthesis family protein
MMMTRIKASTAGGTAAVGGGASESPFELRDLVSLLRVRRRVIIFTTLLVVALVALAISRVTPLYTARALVMLDQRETNVVDVQAVLSGLPTDPTSVENQVQILYSRNLLARVVDKLALENDPEFNPPPRENPVVGVIRSFFSSAATAEEVAPPADQLPAQQPQADAVRDAVVQRLISRVGVTAQGRSTAIQIRFSSADPAKAALIANAIATAYVEDQLNAKFEATQTASTWLADRVRELATQAQAADVAVQQYKARNNLAETPGGDTIVGQQLAQLNGQLVTARSDLAEQEAKYARVMELQQSGRAADVSQVVASPLISELRSQEATLIREEAELSSRYGARHPRMIDMESQKRNLAAKIDEEVRRVVETVSSDVAISRARVNSLQASLNQLMGRSTGESVARIQLRELESAAASSRSMYDTFLARYRETQQQQDIQTPDARIISSAQVPSSPSSPNKTLALGMALPGGLFLGFLLAIMAEKMDPGFRTSLQIERALGLPVLSVFPEVREARPANSVVEKPMSAFAEAVRGLQMGLVLSNPAKRPKVVVITSALPDEGKTTIAIGLARLAARQGQKVALVDGDLRNPGVAKAIGKMTAPFGLIQFLTGEKPLEQCLAQDPRSAALVLPVVGKADSAPDLLGSVAMENLIRALSASHDLVVIDSAPLLPVNDSKILAGFASAVVLAVRWEKTPREAVIGAANSLAEVGTPVAGVVLTRADRKRHNYYNFGYGTNRAYDKYYTE